MLGNLRKRRLINRRKYHPILAAAAMLAMGGSAWATAYTWNSNTTGNWGDANWNSGSPTGNVSADTLTFSPTANGTNFTSTNNVDSGTLGTADGFLLNQLTLGGTGTTVTAGTISASGFGGPLVFSGSGAAVNLSSTSTTLSYNITVGVVLNANTAFTNTASGIVGSSTYDFTGGVSGAGFTLSRSGKGTLRLGGAVTVGSLDVSAAVSSANQFTTTVKADSGATFTVGSVSAAGALTVGVSTSTNASYWGALDLSLASSFTAYLSQFDIGITTGTTSGLNSFTSKGSITLAASNLITATTINLGKSSNSAVPTGDPGGTASIIGGTGATTIHANTLNIGQEKTTGLLSVDAGGTLTLDGPSSGRMAINIGTEALANVSAVGTLTDNGTFSGNLSTLEIGVKALGLPGNSNNGNVTGTLNLSGDAGNHLDLLSTSTTAAVLIGRLTNPTNSTSTAIAATGTWTVGNLDGSSQIVSNTANAPGLLIGSFVTSKPSPGVSAAANGTVNFNGGSLTITTPTNTPSIKLAEMTGSSLAATDSSTGTLNLNGGIITVNNDIVGGTAVGSGIVSSNINIAGGTLDLGGKSLGSVANPITNVTFASGGLANVGGFNSTNASVLTKTTTGTFAISGSNTFTNNVAINGGSLNVTGTTSGSGGWSFGSLAADTTLGGSGTIGLAANQSVTIAGTSGSVRAIVAPTGASTLTINTSGTGETTFGDNGLLNITLNNDSIGLLATQALDLSSSLDGVSITATGTQTEDRYVFATYTGSLSSNVFDNVSISGLADASIDYSVSGQIAVVVPEPSTISLGLFGLVILRRRRTAKYPVTAQ